MNKAAPPVVPPRQQNTKRLAIVLGGILAGQAILFGPSLLGFKVLLPVDILTLPDMYIPRTPAVEKIVVHDRILSDLVLEQQPAIEFAASEIRAGRLPTWYPYHYAGAPYRWPKFSPFWILDYCFPHPIAIAWRQVLVAMAAGLGAYFFCMKVLCLRFWPAAIAAWCYPLTGCFILWQVYFLPCNTAWLPWMLLAVDMAVRRKSRWAGPALAVVAFLEIISGQIDVAAQVLLASGLYAVWCLFDEYGLAIFRRPALGAAVCVAGGWAIGILLSSPDFLPLLEYSRTGSRILRREAGEEERPPIGRAVLPQAVLPDMYGTNLDGSFPNYPPYQGNQMESTAAAYTGLLATLFLAPLAWCSRRHRSINAFWIALGFLGLAWCLDVPGVVDLMRMPGLKMMSHNRFVFVTSFAILALATVGLDVLWQETLHWRLWFWLPIGLLLVLLLFCLYRTAVLPEPVATRLGRIVAKGELLPRIADLAAVRRIQATYVRYFATSAVLCSLGLACWLLIGLRTKPRPWLLPSIVVLLAADLLWFAHGRAAQCDPALYYPRVPMLEELAKAPPGRVIGYHCLPPTLSQTHGLCDIRGYDAVDPARLMDLMGIVADPNVPVPVLPYAITQWLVPKIRISPAGSIELHPVLDMLNVRYVIFRGSPAPNVRPDFTGVDYWAVINQKALPRVFVPLQVATVQDDRARLTEMAAANFNPRQMAFVEQPVDLPILCHGSARIIREIPTRIAVDCDMDTAGLVVLADLWDVGWNAYYEGKPTPILRTNHAIRGVIVPAGKGALEFRYEPATATLGWRLFALSAFALLGWGYWNFRNRSKPFGHE